MACRVPDAPAKLFPTINNESFWVQSHSHLKFFQLGKLGPGF